MAKDMKIGEVREFRGVKYKCVVFEGLESNCAFWHTMCANVDNCLGTCAGRLRKDKTDVMYIKVEEAR